jgi:hypothetical protein
MKLQFIIKHYLLFFLLFPLMAFAEASHHGPYDSSSVPMPPDLIPEIESYVLYTSGKHSASYNNPYVKLVGPHCHPGYNACIVPQLTGSKDDNYTICDIKKFYLDPAISVDPSNSMTPYKVSINGRINNAVCPDVEISFIFTVFCIPSARVASKVQGICV